MLDGNHLDAFLESISNDKIDSQLVERKIEVNYTLKNKN